MGEFVRLMKIRWDFFDVGEKENSGTTSLPAVGIDLTGEQMSIILCNRTV